MHNVLTLVLACVYKKTTVQEKLNVCRDEPIELFSFAYFLRVMKLKNPVAAKGREFGKCS